MMESKYSISHRDIKPSNILISGENCDQFHLADFSEAKTFEIKGITSSEFTIKGTPNYMSPELK